MQESVFDKATQHRSLKVRSRQGNFADWSTPVGTGYPQAPDTSLHSAVTPQLQHQLASLRLTAPSKKRVILRRELCESASRATLACAMAHGQQPTGAKGGSDAGLTFFGISYWCMYGLDVQTSALISDLLAPA
jgi:hypothetical protein